MSSAQNAAAQARTCAPAVSSATMLPKHWLARVAPSLVAALMLACATQNGPIYQRGRFRLMPALSSDFASGLAVAGIPLRDFDDAPSQRDLDDAYDQALCVDRNISFGPPGVRVGSIEGGDINVLEIEYEEVGGKTPAIGAIAEIYQAKYLPADPPPLPEVGDLWGISLDLGPLFATSREGLYVILARGDDDGAPDAPRVFRLVRVLRPEFMVRHRMEPIAQIESLIASDAEHAEEWSAHLRAAGVLGGAEVSKVTERIELESEPYTNPAYAALDAEAAASTLAGHFLLLFDAAEATAVDARANEKLPLGAVLYLNERLDTLIARCKATLAEKRASGKTVEATCWERLVETLEMTRLVREEPWHLVPWPRATTFATCMQEAAWFVENVEGIGDGDLLDRLIRHHNLANHTSRPPGLGDLLMDVEREQLAKELSSRAMRASQRKLRATAVGYLVLVHGLRTTGAHHAPEAEDLGAVAQAVFSSTSDDPLVEARREALPLAARILPFLDPERVVEDDALLWTWLTQWTPLEERLGLKLADLARDAAYAKSEGAPLLDLEIGAPEVASVVEETWKQPLVKWIRHEHVVQNDEAVNRWLEELDAFDARITGAADAYSAELDAASNVTSTLGWKERQYVYMPGAAAGESWFQDVSTVESYRSIWKRGEAATHAAGAYETMLNLVYEREQLYAQRPPSALTYETNEMIQYERELQWWRLTSARDVRLSGGTTPLETRATVEQWTPIYQRIAADPAHGIEAVDEFRSEADVRANDAWIETTRAMFTDRVLSGYIIERLDEYDAELASSRKRVMRGRTGDDRRRPGTEVRDRDYDQAQCEEEHRWARWLFAKPFGEEAGDPGATDRQERLVDLVFDEPSNPTDLLVQARYFWSVQNLDRLFETLDRCGVAFSRNSEYWAHRAEAHYVLGHYDEAADDYRRAVDFDPTWKSGVVGLALCRAIQDRWAEAAKLFDNGLSFLSESDLAKWQERAESVAIGKSDDISLQRAIKRLRYPNLNEEEVFAPVYR